MRVGMADKLPLPGARGRGGARRGIGHLSMLARRAGVGREKPCGNVIVCEGNASGGTWAYLTGRASRRECVPISGPVAGADADAERVSEEPT